MKKKLWFCFFVIILFFAQQAIANEITKAEIIGNGLSRKHLENSELLDETSLNSVGRFVWDFTNIAFSDELWLENSFEPWNSVEIIQERIKSNKLHSQPWMAELGYEKKLPSKGVVGKWKNEIAIGIDWPNVTPTDFKKIGNAPFSESEIQPLKENIVALIPELKALTGLPVRFVEQGEPSEITKRFSGIRIVPIRTTKLKNIYKALIDYPPNITAESFINQFIETFITAVPFTPHSRSQVDGFLLPKFDNSLGIAICRILLPNTPEMVKALVTECLVRSLGLPELSKLDDKSFLGHWNATADAVSKTPEHDGYAAFMWPGTDKEYLPVAKSIVPKEIPSGLTEYDRRMIKLLYCPGIKSGMSRLEAIVEIYSNPECLEQIEEKGK